MTQTQMITALTTALQTADSNGEFSNVTLIMQTLLINYLQNASIQQLENMCSALNINTSGN